MPSPTRYAGLITLLCALAPGATAQSHFERSVRRHTTLESQKHTAVAAGDIDADGDVDAVFVVEGQVPRIYRNDGSAVFTVGSVGLPSTRWTTRSVRLIDLDGDLDLDLLLDGRGFYANDGLGNFTDVTAQAFPVPPTQIRAVVEIDADGDGDFDVFLAEGNSCSLWINDGAGRFAVAPNRVPAVNTLAAQALALDVDGDGDHDIVVAALQRSNDRHYLFLNDGSGTFVDESSSRLPIAIGGVGSGAGSVAQADVDLDGDTDLVFATRRDVVELYENDGTGRFSTAPTTAVPLPVLVGEFGYADFSALEFADADGDGDPDLFAMSPSQGRFLALNDGNGVFTVAPPETYPQRRTYWTGQAVADFDGDGDVDVVHASTFSGIQPDPPAGVNSFLLNDSAGRFLDVSAWSIPSDASGASVLAAADMDGDSFIDLISAEAGRGIVRVLRNDGTGGFAESAPVDLGQEFDPIVSLAIGDVDADGDLDVFIGREGPQDSVLLGDGRGGLARSSMPLPPIDATTHAAILVDVDRDGDLDLVTAGVFRAGGGSGSANFLFINDGAGSFSDETVQRLPMATGFERCVAAIDVDADGALDLMFGRTGALVSDDRLFRNDGNGFFVDESSLRLPRNSRRGTSQIVIGDLDGDGFDDIVLPASSSRDFGIYFNNGFGFFVDASSKVAPGFQGGLFPFLLDVERDGDLDIVVASPFGRFLRNDGGGAFTAVAGAAELDGEFSGAASAADFDGDGDIDLVSSALGRLDLSRNLLTQIRAPHCASLGRRWTVELIADAGLSQNARVVGSWLSAGRGAVAADPYGVFYVDLSQLIGLPAVSLPSGVRAASLAIALPTNPDLQGLTITLQSAFLDLATTRIRLSNPLTERLR